jgi:hypothetical protein
MRQIIGIRHGLIPCGLLLASPALATDWVKTASGSDNMVVYVDRDTIVRNGSHVLAWEKWDFTATPRNPKRAYVVEKNRREHDCTAGVSRIREAIEYDATGRVLNSFSWVPGESQYRAAPPESIGAATFSFVCGGESSPPPG